MRDILRQRLEKARLSILKTHDDAPDRAKNAIPKIDGVLVSNIVNVRYMTGFTGSAGLALIMPDRAYFITDTRYSIRAKEECPYFEILISTLSESTNALLAKILSIYKKDVRIGFETSVSYSQIEAWKKSLGDDIRWRPVSGLIEHLRMIKDETELAAIRKAVKITNDAFDDVSHLLIPGVTEKQFALELDFAMRRRGADGPSFESIVASGPYSARPHHTPTDRAFEAGDMVIIDWGALVDGYCGDLTRSVIIAGAEPTQKQRDVHQAVLEACQIASAAIRPGVSGKEIDSIARDHIIAKGFRDDCFGHSLGHSIGRVVHDGMTLSPGGSDFHLQPGIITTVEPGIYIEGWGGVRIEEDVLVTETGFETLSRPSDQLNAPGKLPENTSAENKPKPRARTRKPAIKQEPAS
jgi:Xaa-Pro aminopeptidase